MSSTVLQAITLVSLVMVSPAPLMGISLDKCLILLQKLCQQSNFCLDRFIVELERSQQDFTAQAEQMQRWAETTIAHIDVKELLKTIMKSERKAEKMYSLYNNETITRGRNLWALYSAFTNYASYADERNGFALRNTGHDTRAISMFQREVDVSNWIESPAFRELAVAA